MSNTESITTVAAVESETHSIEICDVAKFFGDSVALERVSINIRKGEFFSLLGPSGCGKTTLLRMIGGFEAPSIGDIKIDGQSVLHLAPHSRPTNMVFQSLALFPHLNVRENIAFGLRVAGLSETEIRTKVDRFLSVIRLEGYADRAVSALSGGQQQRVAIARALVNEPKVLLLDEPLSALDSKLREEMQVELRRIQKLVGSTFIFVTHDQAEAMSMSDRIAVLNNGRIQQVGSPEELYNNPRNRFVANFIGHSNLIEGNMSISEDGEAVSLANNLRLPGQSIGTIRAGTAVTGALRYEEVNISADLSADGLTARVVSRTFHGAFNRVICKIEDHEIIADVSKCDVGIIPDKDVKLSWAPEALRILPQEPH